jgi:hypothetical protein
MRDREELAPICMKISKIRVAPVSPGEAMLTLLPILPMTAQPNRRFKTRPVGITGCAGAIDDGCADGARPDDWAGLATRDSVFRGKP